MEKISFKVSARTAKLIGQENFSNPEGAIIELVKNCYDADAKNCIVIFDIVFDSIPEALSGTDFKMYSEQSEIIGKSYERIDSEYKLTNKIKEKELNELTTFFFSFNAIYIIDNGSGMTRDIIQNYWMEIGTGNKQVNYVSDDGRIKTGAKGIGRFALDRLGSFVEMWTKSKQDDSYFWSMDWKQFDIPNKSVSEVEADLNKMEFKPKPFLLTTFRNHSSIEETVQSIPFHSGTVIKITGIKDGWTKKNISSVYRSLEALIPPKDLNIPFAVNFFHLEEPKLFGSVETAYFNDFDYKVVANYNSEDFSVTLDITRNELDLKKIKKEYAYLFKSAKRPFDLATLEKKTFKITKTANELLKWEESDQTKLALKRLGSFAFTYYYLKSLVSQKEDYPFKEVNAKERKEVIDRFGGIKLYRDSFRVRPYGDTGNDWLKLGERASSSPAGAGQRVGDWRVRLHQIAGIINISRISNPNLIDKSDRGGLQENDTFNVLQNFVKAFIYEFELDRSRILNLFYEDAQVKKEEERKKEIQKEAEKLAEKIIAEKEKLAKKNKGANASKSRKRKKKDEKEAYEKVIEESLHQLDNDDEAKLELAMVRTLASLGIIISSFAHELRDVKHSFEDINKLENILKRIAPKNFKNNIDYEDAFDIVEQLKMNNQKISHWVDYSLTAIKKDKRKTESIKIDKYFIRLLAVWKEVLLSSNIRLKVKNNIKNPYIFRAFEIDMNTIFNNLIANSVDSFNELNLIRDREITITSSLVDGQLNIIYADNGKGISNVFKKDPNEIFRAFITSKKDKDGNAIGTGLGMYLVKTVVEENGGGLEIMNSNPGFKLKIELPTRKLKSKK